MKLEFEFKTGFSRIHADIETNKTFEDIAHEIWNSWEVCVGDHSFLVENLLWVAEVA